jgi:hypothetical protein
MPAANARLIGISEVGHVDSTGPTDVPWGETQKDAVNLQISVSRVDLRSGQANLKIASAIEDIDAQLQIKLNESALQIMQYALGMPAAKFTGDLEGGTPSAEVLTIDGALGSDERQLYAEGVGPASTRRIDAARGVLMDVGAFAMASNAYMLPTVTFALLNPVTGTFLTITDAL